MITKVKIRYFKLFEEEEFDLSEHVILAGPNNSGKTTLLQAIVVWNLALRKWRAERPGKTTAKQRAGVPITRKDFTAVPLREMKLLWRNTSTNLRKDEAEPGKAGHPRVLEITLEGKTDEGPWDLTFEFRHQSSEQIYVKPAERYLEKLPPAVDRLDVVHVPPFSGIGPEETRYDRPYQDFLVGQGKAGDIIRNLLLDVYTQEDKAGWNDLCERVREVFGYQLLEPQYEGQPFIVCTYRPGVPRTRGGSDGLPRLDLASAGSGFHQVLMLLAFIYARPSTVILLDEPDAHEHIILQKQTYEMLQRIAKQRRSQVIIATHSEVLIDGTSPQSILSFYRKPHRLLTDTDREQVREALKRLTATDLLSAEQSPGILYVEGNTDFDLLRAWADVLNHPVRRWFAGSPFWHSNQGRHPREAREHFFALRAVRPEIRGFLLLDGDNRDVPEREVRADQLTIERWTRYEAESYLVHPDALKRFVTSGTGPLFAERPMEYLRDQIPPAVFRDPLGDHDYLRRTPASKSLLPELFAKAGLELAKNQYYLVAEQMEEEEIHQEVREKLDTIARVFGFSE